MIWDRIRQWCKKLIERQKTIDEFNDNAKAAFIGGAIGVLFHAEEASGDSAFRHPYSKILLSAFTIKSTAGRKLTKEELLYIGRVILNDTSLTRKLYYLGWDTLRIEDPIGGVRVKWAIKDFVKFTYEIEG